MATSTTTFSPKLIIGQQGTGKTYDLKAIAKEFAEQYPYGDYTVWAEDPDEWSDIVADGQCRLNKNIDEASAWSFYKALECVEKRTKEKRDAELAELIIIDCVELLFKLLSKVWSSWDRTDYERETERLLNQLALQSQQRNIFIYIAAHTGHKKSIGARLNSSFEIVPTSQMKERHITKFNQTTGVFEDARPNHVIALERLGIK